MLPGWSALHICIATMLASTGQEPAREASNEANKIDKNPGSRLMRLKIQADIAKVQVDYAHLQTTNDAAEAKKLLDFVAEAFSSRFRMNRRHCRFMFRCSLEPVNGIKRSTW